MNKIVILAVMVLPLVAFAGALTRALFGDRDFVDKIIVFFCLLAAGVVFVTAAAGFMGLIAPWFVVFAGVLIFIFAVVVGRRAKVERIVIDGKISASPPLFLSGVIIIAALTIVFLWSAAAPPPPWDSFVYHLTFPARWLQEGRIFLVTVPFGDQAGTYFPANTELIYLFLMLPFREEFLTPLVQFIFLLGIGAVTLKIAEGAGCSRGSALGAGILAIVVPGMLHQAAAPEVDLAFAFFFLASLHFVLLSIRNKDSLRYFAAASVALGLFAGTKYTALVFGATLLPLFVLAILRRRAGVKLLVFFAACFFAGGFWYARNWLVAGNPFFPLELKVFGLEIFPGGYPRSTMLGSVFHSSDPLEFFAVVREVAGVPLLVALCVGFVVGAWAMVKLGRRGLPAVYPAVLPFALFLIFEFVVPYNREGRFTFAAFALLAVFFAHAMDARGILGVAMRWLHPASVIGALVSSGFLRGTAAREIKSLFGLDSNAVLQGMREPMWLALGLGLCVAAAWLFTGGRKARSGLATALLLIMPLAFFLLYIGSMMQSYHIYKQHYYTGFPIGRAWLEFQQNVPESSTVAFTGTDLSYGLFGPGLRHRVVYVNVNRYGDYHFHDYVKKLKAEGRYFVPPNDRINFHREGADYAAWLANLRAAAADYLFAAVLHQTDRGQIPHDAEFFPVEREWADAHPEVFRLLWSNSQVRIYRLMQK
ncbi:MAG: hypothetical protein ABIH66_05970 [bacterium]